MTVLRFRMRLLTFICATSTMLHTRYVNDSLVVVEHVGSLQLLKHEFESNSVRQLTNENENNEKLAFFNCKTEYLLQ